MLDQEKIKDLVGTVISERFDNMDIVAINVRPDFDDDGDDIITISVIFDGNKRKLDPKKTSSVLRYLLPKIRAAGERGFPVMSFIAKSELGSVSPEAA